MGVPIETWRWLRTAEGQDAIACAPEDTTAASVGRLRKRFDADLARGILEASAARRKGEGKLDPLWVGSLLADIDGVEMASSARSSSYKAERFRRVLGEGARVADLCCGIGADSWGLAGAGLAVTGVDLDEARVEMYTHNLPSCAVVCGDVLSGCPDEVDAFHLDPARRDGTKRTHSLEDFSPGPEVWEKIMRAHGTGAIKLNPGVDAYALPSGEVEILSEPGGLTQAVLWVGGLAGDASRRATVLDDSGYVVSICGEPERPDETNEIGSFIGTLDPCVERADLVETLLDATGTRLVHPGTGLVTSAECEAHGMVRWYRVLEVLPWNEKRVRGVLRGHDAGVVEIRTRGGVVNPDELQRRLRGDGTRSDLSVLVYRLGDRVVSVVAERATEKEPTGAVAPAGSDGGCDG